MYSSSLMKHLPGLKKLLLNKIFMNQYKRIGWIDCAKGIGMLLVIIGHTVFATKAGIIARGIIFSFHMVLFFFLSALTFNPSNNFENLKNRIKKLFIHLIVPTLVTFILIILIDVIKDSSNIGITYFAHKFYSLIMSSGVDLTLPFIDVPRLGAAWFLVVLFSTKILFDFLQLKLGKEVLPIVCFTISLLGVLIGKIQPLPFAMDITFAVLPIFYLGYSFKEKIVDINFRQIIVCVFIWLLLLIITFPNFGIRSYLELAARTYTLYPLCFICAIAGSLSVCGICIKMDKYRITKPLKFLGKNSLYLLVAHILDEPFNNIWAVGNEWINCLLRIAVDIIILVLIVGIKAIKNNLQSCN